MKIQIWMTIVKNNSQIRNADQMKNNKKLNFLDVLNGL